MKQFVWLGLEKQNEQQNDQNCLSENIKMVFKFLERHVYFSHTTQYVDNFVRNIYTVVISDVFILVVLLCPSHYKSKHFLGMIWKNNSVILVVLRSCHFFGRLLHRSAPEVQGPGANSGSDQTGLAPAPGKKGRLQAAPTPYIKFCRL